MTTLATHKRSLAQCIRLGGLALALALTAACASPAGPSITDLQVVTGTTQVAVGQEVAIAASISNPSGESITFRWSVQAGGQDRSSNIVTASPDVASATYRPQLPGNHIITLQMLNKQKAVIASANVTLIAVEAPAATQPAPSPTVIVEATRTTTAPTVVPTMAPTAAPAQVSEPTATTGGVKVAPKSACPGGEVPTDPQPMPFWVYGPDGKHFCPSGYMGDAGDIKIVQGDTLNVQYKFQGRGAVCGYSPCKWAGVYWFNPGYTGSEPWASKANSGYNLSVAKAVRFRARSASGARVEFYVGGVTDPNLRYPSSLPKQSTGMVTLDAAWQDFSISLDNVSPDELKYVIDGFGWSTSWDNNAGVDGVTFEIADIRYE